MQRSLIIADLHLVANEAEKNQLFEQFCQQAQNADQVFILGDLFNTWLGDDLSMPHYVKIITLLKNLSQKTSVLIMTGNRDFLLAQDFERQTGCQLIDSPYLLETNDHQYQQNKTKEIMDVNPSAVNELMKKYPSSDLVHGHTHRLNTHVEKTFTRYVLGDWSDTQGNAIEITDQLNRLEIR